AGGLVGAGVGVVAAQPGCLEGALGLVEVAGGVGEQMAERRAGRSGLVREVGAPLLQGEDRAVAGEGLGDRAPGADPRDVAAPLPLPLGAEHDRGGLEPELVEQVQPPRCTVRCNVHSTAHGAAQPASPKRSSSASVTPGQMRTWSGPKLCSPRKAAVRPRTGSTHRKDPAWPKWPKVCGEECAPVQWGSFSPRISTPSPQSLGFCLP